MSIEWQLKYSLNKEIENGNIYGYVTNTKTDVQLENYMEGQDVIEVVPIIQEKYETIAILKNMYVTEEERGNGIGTYLLDDFIGGASSKSAKAIVLVADTSDSNEFDLVKWYEDWGFKIIYGERSSFPVMIKEM